MVIPPGSEQSNVPFFTGSTRTHLPFFTCTIAMQLLGGLIAYRLIRLLYPSAADLADELADADELPPHLSLAMKG